MHTAHLNPDCMSGAIGASFRGGGGGGGRLLFISAAARFHQGPLPPSCSACTYVQHGARGY
jgi:hypothetical protein